MRWRFNVSQRGPKAHHHRTREPPPSPRKAGGVAASCRAQTRLKSSTTWRASCRAGVPGISSVRKPSSPTDGTRPERSPSRLRSHPQPKV